MRGKRLPELAAYGVDWLLAEVRELVFSSLLTTHCHLLSQSQWQSLVCDFEAGKAHAELEFRLKTDWTQRLPWKLAVLACGDQGLARREVQSLAAAFDSQSGELQKLHHPATLQVLAKGGQGRQEVDRFLSGAALEDLPELLRFAACCRFVQISERQYEAAHSILKRRTPPNASGPCVSLTLPLQNLSADVRLQPGTLLLVAEHMDCTRAVANIPHLLNITQHPSLLVANPRQRWKLVRMLNEILYRCDSGSQHPDVSHFQARHQKTKRDGDARGRCLAKAKAKPAPVTYETLRATALFANFISVADDDSNAGAMFSLPARCLQPVGPEASPRAIVQELGSMLRMTDSCHPGPSCSSVLEPLDMASESGRVAEVPSSVALSSVLHARGADRQHFRILHTTPSSRRTMSLYPAAAGVQGRLQKDDVAILLHQPLALQCSPDENWVCLTPQQDAPALAMLTEVVRQIGFQEMSAHLALHRPEQRRETLVYTLPVALQAAPKQQAKVCDVVTALVKAEAFPGSSCFVELTQADANALAILQQEAAVISSQAGCQLTEHGLSSLLMCACYGSPSPVSAMMLGDQPSAHHLLRRLEDDGWQWQLRRPSAKRDRNGEAVALYYEVGGPKKWNSSTANVCVEYLQCLLQAEELRSNFHILRIPLNASQQVYSNILKGVQPSSVPAPMALMDDIAQPLQSETTAPAPAFLMVLRQIAKAAHQHCQARLKKQTQLTQQCQQELQIQLRLKQRQLLQTGPCLCQSHPFQLALPVPLRMSERRQLWRTMSLMLSLSEVTGCLGRLSSLERFGSPASDLCAESKGAITPGK